MVMSLRKVDISYRTDHYMKINIFACPSPEKNMGAPLDMLKSTKSPALSELIKYRLPRL